MIARFVIVVALIVAVRPTDWRDAVAYVVALLVIAFTFGWARAEAHAEGRCEMLTEIADALDVPHDDCTILPPKNGTASLAA